MRNRDSSHMEQWKWADLFALPLNQVKKKVGAKRCSSYVDYKKIGLLGVASGVAATGGWRRRGGGGVVGGCAEGAVGGLIVGKEEEGQVCCCTTGKL